MQREKTPAGLDRRQSLSGVPMLNEGVTFAEEPETGRVVISVRAAAPRSGFLARWLRRTERTVRLDELGSFVFKLIDNQRDAGQIVAAFAERYRVNRREALLSTIEFLKALARRGIISIVVR